MRLDDLEIASFVSQEMQRPAHMPLRSNRYSRRENRVKTRSGSMLVKIGFCLAVFAAAMLVQRFILEDEEDKEDNTVLAASAENTEADSGESEDALGKLRFVELNETKSVFAVSQRWSLPIKSSAHMLTEDDTLLQINSSTGQLVHVAAAGEVRGIANDARHGDYVRIHHGNDLESMYYNLSDIRVEVGQPLQTGDTLGAVGDTGVLCVAVMQSGVPQSPTEYLTVVN